MEDEELVKVSMSHVLEDHALGLLLETNSDQADDVRVPQVSHQLGLADKVLPSLLVGSGLQRLDRNEAGHGSDGAVAGQLALVDLAKGALAQLLEEPDGGEGQLHGPSLGLLLLLSRGQERSHLHVGLASTVLPAKVPEEKIRLRNCLEYVRVSPAQGPSWHDQRLCRRSLSSHAAEPDGEAENGDR